MFTFKGDLCQMGQQKHFLVGRGFSVFTTGGYPCVQTQKEFDEAITEIWNHEVEGWWLYRERLIELRVCTSEEFTKRLWE